MYILLVVLIIVIALMIIIGIISLIYPWLEFVYDYYLEWVFDKQDEIRAKRNGEEQ